MAPITKKRRYNKKSKKTRKKTAGTRVKSLLTGTLAALALGSGSGAAAQSPFSNTGTHSFDLTSNTFAGPQGFTAIPNVENNPYEFPQANTSLAPEAVKAGMFIPKKDLVKITPMGMDNPTFGPFGEVSGLEHHTLQVEKLDDEGNPTGEKSHIGYYAGLNDEAEIANYQKRHPGRPKLNDPRMSTLLKGGPGKWISDPMVEYGLGKGKKLKPVGESLTVSGDVFNSVIGHKVNLENEGTYSAPGGLVKGALETVLGPEKTEEMCDMGNCQTEAAKVMKKLKKEQHAQPPAGGKKKKRGKTRRKRRRPKRKRNTHKRKRKK